MEALNDAEKNTQAQINKALEAAKVLLTFCHSLNNINISYCNSSIHNVIQSLIYLTLKNLLTILIHIQFVFRHK